MTTSSTTEAGTPAIPQDVISKLKKFNDALTALEDALQPHFDIGFEQHLEVFC